ncbi:MAG: TIGR01212 family radical SAM protein [Bacteroidales bacterium]
MIADIAPSSWAMQKGGRRFYTYSEYFRKRFGERVQKVAINAGFTCPNRDGSKGNGGCTFCCNSAFSPSYCSPQKSIQQQIAEGIEFHSSHRYKKANQYLAYFQSFSNTYAPLSTLQSLYTEALSHPNIIGLIIGTRPDCVDDEILDYIAEIAKTHYVSLEYGIESCYDRTLERINRGHNFEQTQKAIHAAAQRGINTGGHIIFGLPGEQKSDMLSMAKILSELPLHSIKFHQLQLMKDTKILLDFEQNPQDFVRFELEEYIDFFIDFLEQFSPQIIIERFIGEAPPRFVEYPLWGKLRNEQVLQMLDKRLEQRDTYQGKLFK